MSNTDQAIDRAIIAVADGVVSYAKLPTPKDTDNKKLTNLIAAGNMASQLLRARADAFRTITTATRVTEDDQGRISETLQVSSPTVESRLAALERRVTADIQGGQQSRLANDQVAIHGEEWRKSAGH